MNKITPDLIGQIAKDIHDIKIEARHEDKIYPAREFFCRLKRVMDEQYAKLLAELREDGFTDDKKVEAFLFDYIYNSDIDEEAVGFEEYCDGGFMLEYYANQERKKTSL